MNDSESSDLTFVLANSADTETLLAFERKLTDPRIYPPLKTTEGIERNK